MRQMQDQMNEMDRKMNESATRQQNLRKEGDYIDYEEVR
jgi:hypothetical protein